MTPRWQRHWTPRYVVARAGDELFRRRHPNVPWITPAAVHVLDEWLRPDDVVVEYGSGRSTSWLAARCAAIVSIEHDPVWYERVSTSIRQSDGANVDLRLVSADQADVYAAAAADVRAAHLVLVDGKHRSVCTQRAIDVVVPGGLIVLDDANRYLPHPTSSPVRVVEPAEGWAEVARELSDWRSVWTTNGVADTALFWKPS